MLHAGEVQQVIERAAPGIHIRNIERRTSNIERRTLNAE